MRAAAEYGSPLILFRLYGDQFIVRSAQDTKLLQIPVPYDFRGYPLQNFGNSAAFEIAGAGKLQFN